MTTNVSNIKIALAITALCVSGLFSCEPEKSFTNGSLRFVHSDDLSDSVLIFVDGLKSSKILRSDAVTNYDAIQSGTRTIEVRSARKYDQHVLINLSKEVMPGSAYTLIMLGGATPDEAEPVWIEDDLSAPSAGTIKIRFVNLAIDISDAALFVQGSANGITPTIQFKEASQFVEIDATDEATFEAQLSDGHIVQAESFSFLPGEIYTFYLQGNLVDGLYLNVIQNH